VLRLSVFHNFRQNCRNNFIFRHGYCRRFLSSTCICYLLRKKTPKMKNSGWKRTNTHIESSKMDRQINTDIRLPLQRLTTNYIWWKWVVANPCIGWVSQDTKISTTNKSI
jgi:hypothetical protein